MFPTTLHTLRARLGQLLRGLAALLLLALSLPSISIAQDGGHSLGAGSHVVARPLQELIGKVGSKGLVFVAIPQALMYGEGSGQRPYCSPQIRATNSSNRTVEELIVGIRYKTASGKGAGTSVTRFFRIKVSKQETHYFYSTITAPNCKGLTGELEVIRCVYDNGAECNNDVRVVEYGAVPLRIVDKE